jgi:HAD superfamily hydrolase (TIGR01509 family)
MKKDIGVIFDMDGVIVNSNPAHEKAIKTFCSKHGKDVSDSFLNQNVYGRPNKEWIPDIFGDIDEDKLKELSEEKENLFRDIFSPKDHAVECIQEFLDKLEDQDIAISLATSAPQKNVNYTLSQLSIEDYFSSVLGPEDIENGKPDPEVYLKSAEALGKQPENCVVFEDSIAGVKSGLKAGAKVVGLTTTESEDDLPDCHLIIANFCSLTVEDLLKLF